MNKQFNNNQILRPERTNNFNPMATPWDNTKLTFGCGLKAQLNLPIQGEISNSNQNPRASFYLPWAELKQAFGLKKV